jgi:DNA-binding transcriptional ArsR family regulator
MSAKTDRERTGRRQDGRGTPSGTCGVFVVDEERVSRAREHALDQQVVGDVAETFKVLASPTRVRIIRALAREELCVCDLAQTLEMSVSAISHQLQAMRRMKLVQHRMDGKLAYYSLRDPFVLALITDCVRHLGGEGPA